MSTVTSVKCDHCGELVPDQALHVRLQAVVLLRPGYEDLLNDKTVDLHLHCVERFFTSWQRWKDDWKRVPPRPGPTTRPSSGEPR